MTAREIAAALGNARPSGKDWRCRCPLCDHNNPTLCDDGGRLVVRCLSGCASRDVHKELCCRHLGGNGRANGNGNGNRVAALETCTEHEAKAATATAKRTSRKMRPVLAHSPGPHRMCQTPQGGNLANDAARRCP
jgi:hypothetical protein